MNRTARLIVALALAARLILALGTAFDERGGLIPSFNDEMAHFNYVRFVSEWGRLPVQTESVQEGFDRAEFEYYQAPLYYLLARPFYAIGRKLTPGREVHWVRLASVLFSVAGLIVLYLSVRAHFGDSNLSLSVLLLGAFSGVPLRFGSLVTNDGLLFLIVCLYFALIVEILRSGCDGRLLIAGILTAAAGLWTKASFILILPLFPAVLLFGPKRSIWKAVAALLLPTLAILPWYLRNHILYGSWLPISTGFGTPDLLSAHNFFSRISILGNYFVRSLTFPYDAWWGAWVDKIIYPLEGAVFIILLWQGLRILAGRQRSLAWVLLTIPAVNLISYLYLNYLYSQAEARYFLPALPFILVLLALGAEGLAGKRKSRAFALLGLWMVLPWLTLIF
jgi:4-amino-4-deoxy-L-arabinose transferase-like glycosyltransferase